MERKEKKAKQSRQKKSFCEFQNHSQGTQQIN